MSLNPHDIFGQTIECACGKTHVVTPAVVVYAPDAMDQLPEVAGRFVSGRRAAVVMDARTREAAGSAAAGVLSRARWQVAQVVIPDGAGGSSPVCDDVTQEALGRQVGDVDLVVAAGSGVVNDLCKWLAFQRGVPYISVATAASMNGYTSANVAPTLRGVKSLLRARPPAAVLAEPRVIENSPFELTAAGLGDVLAKSVSSTDWYMNHLLFGDYFCRRSVDLIATIEPLYLARPQAIAQRDPQAVAAVFRALLLTGAAMTMAESSAPASGGEHMISHTLDMMSHVDGHGHDLHGRQVGVGTVLAAEIYRRVLAAESPEWVVSPPEVDRAFWGPLGAEMAAQHTAKIHRLGEAAEELSKGLAWDNLRAALAPMLRSPEVIRDCLAGAKAGCSADDIRCTPARLAAALGHAHEIRSRFTVLDLARITGVMPRDGREIVQQWAS